MIVFTKEDEKMIDVLKNLTPEEMKVLYKELDTCSDIIHVDIFKILLGGGETRH